MATQQLIIDTYEALRDLINSADNGMPYTRDDNEWTEQLNLLCSKWHDLSESGKAQDQTTEKQPTNDSARDFALEVLNEINDAGFIDCNCSGEAGLGWKCDGTCTHARIQQVIRRLKSDKTKWTAAELGNAMGVQCPVCGAGDSIHIVATTLIELTPDGSLECENSGGHEFDGDSNAHCDCNWHGKVSELVEVELVWEKDKTK